MTLVFVLRQTRRLKQMTSTWWIFTNILPAISTSQRVRRSPSIINSNSLSVGEEPLLKESKCRFILFPNQYHEVSISPPVY